MVFAGFLKQGARGAITAVGQVTQLLRGDNPMRSNLLSVLSVAAIGVAMFAVGFLAGQENKVNTSVYELRTYTTEPGRLPALHKRFKDHTIKLFEKHGMKNGMYWVPTEEDNKLIYVVEHESREAAEKSWSAFRNDPDWKKVAAESEADGKIVAKVDRVFMRVVDYSPVK
jgi:hypothetical protein